MESSAYREASYLVIEPFSVYNVVIDNLDIKAPFCDWRKILDQLPKLRSTDTVGTIDCYTSVRFLARHRSFESVGNLLIITLFRWCAIFKGSSFGVETTCEIVELRGGQNTIISEVGVCSVQAFGESFDQMRTRSPSVTSKDDSRLDFDFDTQIRYQLFNSMAKRIIGVGVGQRRCVSFPRCLSLFSRYPRPRQPARI